MKYWWVFYLSVQAVVFCVFTPLIIYLFYNFWKSRNLDVVAVRRPKFVAIFCALAMFNVVTRSYFAFLSNLVYSNYPFDESLNDPRIRTPFVFLTQLSSTLLLFRMWIMFFDWRRNVYLLQCKWSKQLLSQQRQQHWTIRYRYVLGNQRLLLCLALVHYITGVILCITAIEIHGGQENSTMYDLIILIDAFIFVVPFIVLSIISQKFHDNFGVRDEIKACVIIFAVGVVIFIAAYFVIVQWDPWVTSPADTILRSQGTYALQTIITVLLVIRVLYVPRLYENLHKLNTAGAKGGKLLRLQSHNSNNTRNGDSLRIKPRLTDVLKCEEGFKIFANHLLKEYSVETLLFLLELTQIKRAIVTHYNSLFSSMHGRQLSDLQQGFERAVDSMTFKLEIHPNILQLSDDVSNNITLAKVVDLWQYIYEQYIRESSVAAINISYEVRIAIWTQINKTNEFMERINDNVVLTLTHSAGASASSQSSGSNTGHSSSASAQASEAPDPAQANVDEVQNSAQSTISPFGQFGSKQQWHDLIMQSMIAFDRAAKEVCQSLENDSWHRFKNSEAYGQWKQQIFDPVHQTRKWTITSMAEKL